MGVWSSTGPGGMLIAFCGLFVAANAGVVMMDCKQPDNDTTTLYDFALMDVHKVKNISLSDYRGKVNFATGPHFLTVHFIDTEERNGNWHHVIRERKNFERRILELEPILTPVLGTSHRAKVLEHRNKSKTTVKDPKMT